MTRPSTQKTVRSGSLQIAIGFNIFIRPHLQKVMRGVARYADQHTDIHIVPMQLYRLGESYMDPWRYFPRKPDGMIAGLPPEALQVLQYDLPRVTIDADAMHHDLPWVGTDYQAVGVLAAEYFLAKGYRRLVYFRHAGESRIPENQMEASFCETLRAADAAVIVFDQGPRTERRGRWTYEDQRDDLGDTLREIPKPFAIFCSDDLHAWRAMDICHLHGIKTPEEAAILGVGDESYICQFGQPNLSSISLNHEKIGYQAAHQLHQLILGQPVEPHQFIKPLEIVPRVSTGHIPIEDPDVLAGLHFIRAHLDETITSEQIAEAVLVSSRTLLRKFRATLGRSPADELKRQRLEEAKRLIRGTQMPLTMIAISTGLGSQSALGRAIKADTGQTPGELRQYYQTTG